MRFREILKQEWAKEFDLQVEQYEGSILQAYHSLLEKVCVRVWNQAIDTAANNAEADYTILQGNITSDLVECYVLKNSILKFKLQDEKQM